METTLPMKTLVGPLEELEAIPLWGTPPPFPWEEFASLLAKNFDIESVEIIPQKTEYLSFESITQGMGEDPHFEFFALSPLPGTFFFLCPRESRKALANLFLYEDQKGKEISDEVLEKGFFKSLLLLTCTIFNHLSPFGNLSCVLEEPTPLPEEGALCIDLMIKLEKTKLSSRIVIPKEAHASFRTHFAMERPPLLFDPNLNHLPLPVRIEAGSTTLSAEEWKKVSVGDFILLDRCTYDLDLGRGTAQLTLGNTPLFEVRIKEKEVKLLEHAQYLEENPMIDETPPEKEQPIHEETETEAPLWSTDEEKSSEEEMLASKEIPISLVVEVGRFKMPLAKLTKLKPGNVLDLALNPQLGVHLTIGGKRVAKGELVKIGEGIGVKILKVGE